MADPDWGDYAHVPEVHEALKHATKAFDARHAHIVRWLRGLRHFAYQKSKPDTIYESRDGVLQYCGTNIWLNNSGAVFVVFNAEATVWSAARLVNLFCAELQVPWIEVQTMDGAYRAVGCIGGKLIEANQGFEIAGPLTLMAYRARHHQNLLP